MQTTSVYIIRHAETVGNIEKRLTGRQDYEITENGMQTIRRLENKLEGIKFDLAFASTESRSFNTIKGLAEKSGIEIIKTPALSEMYFGIYDGFTWEEVNRINPKIKQLQNEINIIAGIPNQETMEEVADRVYNFIYKCCLENSGKTILMGSHGVAIEAFLRKITNLPFKEEREKYCQHNSAVNKVIFNNNKFEIEILSDKEVMMPSSASKSVGTLDDLDIE